MHDGASLLGLNIETVQLIITDRLALYHYEAKGKLPDPCIYMTVMELKN